MVAFVKIVFFDTHLKVIINRRGRLRIVERFEEVDAAILEFQRLLGAVVQRVDDRAEVLFALDHARVLAVDAGGRADGRTGSITVVRILTVRRGYTGKLKTELGTP